VEEEITARHLGLRYERNESVRLSDFIKRYLGIKTDKKSWDRDSQRLGLVGEVWGDLALSSIGKAEIEKLEKYLVETKKIRPATVNHYFEMLRHFFNLAMEEGYQFFLEEGKRRALSREEVSRILDAARTMQAHPRTSIQAIIYDLILFALNTGMRLSEILFLKKSYIVEDMIYYPTSKTKSRRRSASPQQRFKIILLNTQARAIIERGKPQDDYVFPMK
jgi:integrase